MDERAKDRDWIGWVRRDVKVAAELAAVAEAAVRSIQETGGTPLERAGVLRIVGMARNGAASAIEQLDAVEKREHG